MTDIAVASFAVTYPNIATWHFLQHKRKVFRTHGGGYVVVNAVSTND